MTPAMELKKTEYAERYDVKLLLLVSKFHGHMHKPTTAAIYPPRRMFYEINVKHKRSSGMPSYRVGTRKWADMPLKRYAQ